MGSRSTAPVVTSELPFIQIGAPVLDGEKPTGDPAYRGRRYVYEATLASDSPKSQFAGRVLVVDPWDAHHVEHIRVYGGSPPPIKAVPGRIILSLKPGTPADKNALKVLIMSSTPAPDIVVELRETGSPLTLGEVQISDEKKLASFSVSLKPGTRVGGEYTILVGRRSSPDRITVPVVVREGDRP